MVWRATPEEGRHTKSAERRLQMLSRIGDNIPVGLIGYADGEPTAWISIAPKLTHRKQLAPAGVDATAVWSLTCMYLHKSLRGQGLGAELVLAAIAHARAQGAASVEAYPVDPQSPSYRFMGFVPQFEKLGFVETATVGTRRHVMRLQL